MQSQVAPTTLDRLRAEPLYNRLGVNDRVRLESLLPVLSASAARAAEPTATLAMALELAMRMAGWPRYLATLSAHPAAIARLVALIGASPWLGQLLIARPALADELLPGRPDTLPDRVALAHSLGETLARCSDDDASQLVALCNFKHSVLLQILALDLEGAIDLDQVSGALSDLAEALLTYVLTRACRTQGLDDPPVAIVAYGKLGSREMSYASDTDIVFLHDLHDGADADAAAATQVAATVNRWLTATSPAGTLYQTDFRLRPHGAHGPQVSSLSVFAAYQRETAGTFEHQALTRARFIAGPPALGERFAAFRREILCRPRGRARLHADVLAMRARLLQSRAAMAPAPPADRFDVKHGRGGVIDIEFVVQALVLGHAAACPPLREATDNATALAAAARAGLVPAPIAAAATAAFRAFRLFMHRERLRGNEAVLVPLGAIEAHRRAGLALWHHVFSDVSP